MMLAVDHKIDVRERTWFLAVMNSFGASFRQKGVLRDHLMNRSKENLETILRRINSADQKRLLNFLRVAMKVDREATAEEKEFFNHVNQLIESNNNVSMNYDDLGRAILDRDKDIELWNALSSLGKFLSIKRYGVNLATYYPHEYNTVRWDVLVEALFDKRNRLWLIGFLVVIFSFLYWLK